MKRLLIIASLAILAMSCEKTIVSNGVRTPIGFSTEVGKQTRAVVQDNAYPTDQPFAVYAYGHQDLDTSEEVTTIMNNVEVSYTPADNTNPAEKWSATGNTKYYWPNDPRTTINFYAYSPALVNPTTATANHQKLNGTIAHRETADNSGPAGLSLTGYTHSNMYVDFMVARPVKEAKYQDQDGVNGQAQNLTAVPTSFNHQMTQVVFNVKTSEAYSGIIFTVTDITLKNIKDKANYSHTTLTPDYVDQNTSFTQGVWSAQEVTTGANDAKGTFNIFPAEKYVSGQVDNGAPGIDANEVAKEVTDQTVLATTPVTMIPQDLVATVKDQQSGAVTTAGQSFTITYTISGTGVATETVEKTVDLYSANHTSWGVNQKVTYNVTIGLNEILFNPTVVGWEETSGGDIDI